MTAPQQDAPRPKMPSLRTLLVRAVAALERIADELEFANTGDVADDAPVCGASFLDAFKSANISDELRETAAKCTLAPGHDSPHLHAPSGTRWP